MQPENILHFWFDELTDKQHFAKDAALDELIRSRFGQTLEAAARCELFAWRGTAGGRLAEIIVLDQFSRNVYRDTPLAFAQDGLALCLAQELVGSGQDQLLSTAQRRFAYMPYMHSESPLMHAQAVQLFAQPGLQNNLDFELRHQAIIARFGRYPHRNAVLGRASTAEELAFLNEPGSFFKRGYAPAQRPATADGDGNGALQPHLQRRGGVKHLQPRKAGKAFVARGQAGV